MRVLKLGCVGKDVKTWQLFLFGKGFYKDIADGKFGQVTVDASKIFQASLGLTADGVVGPMSIGKALALGLPLFEDETVSSEETRSVSWPAVAPGIKFPSSSTTLALVGGPFKYKKANNAAGEIIILGTWEADNIETAEIPQLEKATNGKNKKMRFHKKFIPQLLGMWKAWEEAGLLSRVLTYEGAFYPRFIRGSNTALSNHSMGTAFDINYEWNQLGQTPALVGDKGCVRELVPIANKFGFYWGGHYPGRKDGMHFEVCQFLDKLL